jgi:hypothetical protein
LNLKQRSIGPVGGSAGKQRNRPFRVLLTGNCDKFAEQRKNPQPPAGFPQHFEMDLNPGNTPVRMDANPQPFVNCIFSRN